MYSSKYSYIVLEITLILHFFCYMRAHLDPILAHTPQTFIT
jgi:hypothetical protein